MEIGNLVDSELMQLYPIEFAKDIPLGACIEACGGGVCVGGGVDGVCSWFILFVAN